MLTSAGPKRLPIATPSVCLYMTLLKLNSTDFVASFINSMEGSFENSGAAVDHSRECQHRFEEFHLMVHL